MYAAHQPIMHTTSLQLDLNYQRQLLNLRKRAGAGLAELSIIEHRIARLVSQLALAVRPSAGEKDPGFFNSSGS